MSKGSKMDENLIKETAEAEIWEAKFREAVDAEKERILTNKSLWNRLFPFRIIVVRKDS